MKLLKRILFLCLISLVMMSFSQCASTFKLQDSVPLEIGQVYHQSWVAGVKGGGSGINVFIPLLSNSKNIVLDSIYFRGKAVKLEKDKMLYIGRYALSANQNKDIIMSSDPIAEYGNLVPEIPKKIPFELKEDECVVSYNEGHKIKYYKISNIIEQESLNYPSAPQNSQ
ncbi:hypothetical protein Q4Q34_06855 [Flavivirga abyssicola]|uniref:hypothetical protein n=1 Tax=Flavivirga abyssicola TaxID=3063533 RepID=UPI0026DEB005|nr:hypothetical protein [Flavivirga sp. MEBiC07777]WVK14747.1 hypothetical protein Q4Q34_06855 [Flavivirga sp. MEBiC07777]